MLSFEQLIGEHDAICAAANAFERSLNPAKPNVTAALASRARLCTLLDEHLAHEDAQVYPQLILATHERTADIARRFSAEFSTLVEEWTAYLAHWSAEAIAAEWHGFRDATTTILGVLRKRIEAENALLYPTALGASVLTLRA
ncbi:MAG: hemerythrin domain-containing protein [Sphingomonadales bacterium]